MATNHFAILALCALLAGCVSVDQDRRYRDLKRTAGQEVTAAVVVGTTTRDALIDRLGAPDANWTADGQEVLRWDSTRETRTHFRIFPLLSVNLSKEDPVRYYFALNNGVVVRTWHSRHVSTAHDGND